MALATNIVRRSGSKSYYLRCSVPKDLQDAEGRKEVWKSLRTSDPTEARKRARIEATKLDQKWEQARDEISSRSRQIEEAPWLLYNEKLQELECQREEIPTDEDLDALWEAMREEYGEYDKKAWDLYMECDGILESDREKRRNRMKELSNILANNRLGQVRNEVEAAAKRIGIRNIEKDAVAYRRLAGYLIRAEIEALRRSEERDAGDFTGQPKDPIIKKPKISASKAIGKDDLATLFEQYKKEKEGSIRADTWNQNSYIIRMLIEYLDGEARASLLARDKIRGFKEALFEWPVKAADINEFKGKKFKQIIELNKKLKRPTISKKTINKYLSAIGSFSKWLYANGYVTEKLMDGMYLEINKSKKNVYPYTDADLRVLFSSPLYVGCMGDGEEYLPGPVQIRDWRYWIPLLAAYSGARLGEIAQLKVSDIKEIEGVVCMHITTLGDDKGEKSTKNAGSERVIPLHKDILELGFIEKYYNEKKEAGEGQLFPEITRDARGFISGMPSSYFNKYFKKIGIKADRTKNFHSLRHGAIDAMRLAGRLDAEIGPIVGHVEGTTTQRYGTVSQVVIKTRKSIIDGIEYSGICVKDGKIVIDT